MMNMDLDLTVNANRSAENFQIPFNLHACFLSLQTHSQFTFRQEPLSVDDFSGQSLFVFSDGNNPQPFKKAPQLQHNPPQFLMWIGSSACLRKQPKFFAMVLALVRACEESWTSICIYTYIYIYSS